MKTTICKKWIRGSKERGAEVIAELEKLGGKNEFGFSASDDEYIYFINSNGNIDGTDDLYLKTLFAWAGEEITLPEQKPEPKFKVGDKVKSEPMGYVVLTVRGIKWDKEFNKYVYKVTDNHWASETCLSLANNLKEFDPVMVSEDGKTWKPAFYNTHSTVYMLLEENDSASKSYKYIVPLADFDFNDLASNTERSVV